MPPSTNASFYVILCNPESHRSKVLKSIEKKFERAAHKRIGLDIFFDNLMCDAFEKCKPDRNNCQTF